MQNQTIPCDRPVTSLYPAGAQDDVPDRPREACGIFGIVGPAEDIARITYFGLYALQHRGQESAGIATSDGLELYDHRQMGLVAQAFSEDDLAQLPGHLAIGHTRYSTTGSSRLANAQPLVMDGTLGRFALGHNGNLTNTLTLRDRLLSEGETLQTTSDSQIIARLIANAPGATYVEKVRRVMPTLQGAYSLVILTTREVIGVRDPFGVRPLAIGRLQNNWLLASETCAIETVGGEPLRDVLPGEIVALVGTGDSGLQSS